MKFARAPSLRRSAGHRIALPPMVPGRGFDLAHAEKIARVPNRPHDPFVWVDEFCPVKHPVGRDAKPMPNALPTGPGR